MANIPILRINGEIADYRETRDFAIRLKRLCEDLGDPTRRRFDSTYTFDLIRTRNNDRILGGIHARFTIDKFKNKNYQASLSINNTTILEGTLRVTDISNDEYKCVIYNKIIDFTDAIKSKKLKELVSFGVPEFKYAVGIKDHIHADYDSSETDIQFPYIQYGRKYLPKHIHDFMVTDDFLAPYSLGPTDVIMNEKMIKQYLIVHMYYSDSENAHWGNYRWYYHFPPAIYAISILRYIVKEAGWNIAGSFLQDEDFKKCIIPYTGDSGVWDVGNGIISDFDQTEADRNEFYASRNSTQSITGSASGAAGTDFYRIIFNTEQADEAANYNASTGEYTFSTAYRAYFNVNLLASTNKLYIFSSPGMKTHFRLIVERSAVKTVLDEEVISGAYTNKSIYMSNDRPFDFKVGDKVYMEARIYNSDNQTTAIYVNIIGSADNSTTFNSNFTCRILKGPTTRDFLNIAAFLPDMDQKDFIKELIILFNLQMIINKDNRTIYFEKYSEYYLNNNAYIDVTDKTIDGEFQESALPDDAASVRLTWDDLKDDDVAFVANNWDFPTQYAEMTQIRGKQIKKNGAVYPNNQIFNSRTGVKEIKSKFAPVNFRKYWLINSKTYDGSVTGDPETGPTQYHEIHLPTISTVEEMTKDWYVVDADGADFETIEDASFGQGLRIMRYDGMSEDPRHWVEILQQGGSRFAKMGICSALRPNVGLIDDDGKNFFNTYSTLGQSANTSLSFNNTDFVEIRETIIATIPSTSLNIDSLTSSLTKGKTNNLSINVLNGKNFAPSTTSTTFNKITGQSFTTNPIANERAYGVNSVVDKKDLYSLNYEKKYFELDRSNIFEIDIYFTEQDWNNLQANVPVMYYNEVYRLQAIDPYEPLTGKATLKLLKRVN